MQQNIIKLKFLSFLREYKKAIKMFKQFFFSTVKAGILKFGIFKGFSLITFHEHSCNIIMYTSYNLTNKL